MVCLFPAALKKGRFRFWFWFAFFYFALKRWVQVLVWVAFFFRFWFWVGFVFFFQGPKKANQTRPEAALGAVACGCGRRVAVIV